MSSILTPQGMVLATAMAAVSGTVILPRFSPSEVFPCNPVLRGQPPLKPSPRSCISSDGKNKKEKKKKRVHFAEDVVDPIGNSDEYRKMRSANFHKKANSTSDHETTFKTGRKVQQMPANRMALYNGILRDRVLQRVAYSC